jgi:WD40 repeat protein
MTATHPSDRELSEFLLGKLPDLDQAAIESHFADCDVCRDRALEVPAHDTLVELLASARTRVDSERGAAPTPTLDGAPTPPAFAPTLAWQEELAIGGAEMPPALANHPKYRLIRRLGTGGMGSVWLAEHKVMNRKVAVKVIRPDLLTRPGATGRFLREVRAAAKLHHPNIVTAFDAEEVGDSCLLVMEYVPGETLGERVQSGPLPVAEACRAVRDAACGLATAHKAGLVHRDVKPHNLIRDSEGTTKVLDFGLTGVGAGEIVAANGEGLTGAGMVVGTPAYIAPEQIVDPRSADARADIYGLGCTLYHLLSGRPPVPKGTVADTLAAQQTYVPEPIPGLPEGLADVLAKLIAKRPEDRYQTASEVATALAPFCGSAKVSRERSRKTVRRWLALAAGFLLVVAAGVVFKIQRDNQEITIATDDPDIEVVMKRKGEVVRVIDKKSGQIWEIDTTTNQIGLADTPNGLTLPLPESGSVVMKRAGEKDGKPVFTIARDSEAAKIAASAKVVDRFLKLLDERNFAQIWQDAAQVTRESTTKDEFIKDHENLLRESGKAKSRTLVRRQAAAALPIWGAGDYVLSEFKTSYADGDFTELVTTLREKDGHWRVCGYQIEARPSASERKLAATGADAIARFLTLLDERKYAQCWEEAAETLREGITKKQFVEQYEDLLMPLGRLKKRTIIRQQSAGITFTHGYQSQYADGEYDETITVMRDSDGQWRLIGYEIRPFKSKPSPESPGQVRKFGRFQGIVSHVAADPDGKHAYAVDSGATKWDFNTGTVAWEAPLGGENVAGQCVAYIKGGRILCGCSDGTVRILNAETGKLLQTYNLHAERVLGAAVSPDGTRAVSSSGVEEDGKKPAYSVKVWEVATGKVLFELKGPEHMSWSVIWSQDGRHIATASDDGTVRLWDADAGKELHEFRGHKGMVSAAAFSPDGRWLASGGEDMAVRIWDVKERKLHRTLDGHDVWIVDMHFTPDGTRLVTASGNENRTDGIRVWDVATGKQLIHFREPGSRVNGVTVTPDGSKAVSVEDDGVVRVFRLPTKAGPSSRSDKVGLLHELPWPGAKDANVCDATVSPDGKYVLAADEAGGPLTAIWDRESGTLLSTFPAYPGAVFLPDGKHILGPGRGLRVIKWDVTTGKEVAHFPRDVAWLRLSVSADGSRAVSCPQHGIDEPLVVWDVTEANAVARFKPDHKDGFNAAISPDGKRVVTVGVKDRTIKLWNVAPHKLVRTWKSDEREFDGPITFDPDGWTIVLQAAKGVARIAEGSPDMTWLWKDGVERVGAVSPGGRTALLSDHESAVRGYDLRSGRATDVVNLPGRPKGWMGLSADGRYGAASAAHGDSRVYVFRLPDVATKK